MSRADKFTWDEGDVFIQKLKSSSKRVSVILTKEDRASFDPAAFVARMKAAGFTFDSEVCPVKIAQPWYHMERGDGSVEYFQWRKE